VGDEAPGLLALYEDPNGESSFSPAWMVQKIAIGNRWSS